MSAPLGTNTAAASLMDAEMSVHTPPGVVPAGAYCHLPSVAGLAALPVMKTPTMVSAPLVWLVSLGSLKRGPNRSVTLSPAGVKLPSACGVIKLTSTAGVVATGRSLTGAMATKSVPVVVAAGAVPSWLLTTTVSVAAGVVLMSPVELTSVGAVMVAPTNCAAVRVAVPAVGWGITVPALSLMTQPAGMPEIVAVVSVSGLDVSAATTLIPSKMAVSSRPRTEPATVWLASLPVAGLTGEVCAPVVPAVLPASCVPVPIVRRGASETGVSVVVAVTGFETRPVANCNATASGLDKLTTAPGTRPSIELSSVVPLAGPLGTSGAMAPAAVWSFSTKRTVSRPGVPE